MKNYYTIVLVIFTSCLLLNPILTAKSSATSLSSAQLKTLMSVGTSGNNSNSPKMPDFDTTVVGVWCEDLNATGNSETCVRPPPVFVDEPANYTSNLAAHHQELIKDAFNYQIGSSTNHNWLESLNKHKKRAF